ncbi:MAG: methyltransferase domain-containing protein [Planctomycetes bacterium]|nr:methyltransferase domain-containing protein [Planctomycetota bacterium]
MSLIESCELKDEDYQLIRKLVYAQSGINLGEHKAQLVKSRLSRLLREGRFPSYRAYYQHVRDDPTGEALSVMLDAITTNTTHLFREITHFNRVRQLLTGWAGDQAWRRAHKEVRIWSAACSSGEEPHSLAMTAADTLQAFPKLDFRILATDLSSQMLSQAKLALYEIQRVGTVPEKLRKRYLKPVKADGKQRLQLVPELRSRITFSKFNLMSESFPFKQSFDIIFCRNVMIYFDKPTQNTLVQKLVRHLCTGGHLMIGHSESINKLDHSLTYVEPTVYRK